MFSVLVGLLILFFSVHKRTVVFSNILLLDSSLEFCSFHLCSFNNLSVVSGKRFRSVKKRINQKVCFLRLNVHIHVNIFSLYFLLNEHSISVLSTIDYFHFLPQTMLSLTHTLRTFSHTHTIALTLLLLLPSQKCRVDLSTELDDRAVLLFATLLVLCILFLLAGLLHTVAVAVSSTPHTQ